MNIQKFMNDLSDKRITIFKEGNSLKYRAPKGVVTKQILDEMKENKVALLSYLETNTKFFKDKKSRYERFPLTDIQNSYVMGRNKIYELGGVACHGYMEVEFAEELEINKLEVAWNKVIQKHDMLRAIISQSGYQIVQEAVPYVKISGIDLRNNFAQRQKERDKLRENLANKQYKLGEWPMCDLAVSIENGKSIIHFSLDMLIADFVSMNIVLNDLEKFYRDPEKIIVPTTEYRDIINYKQKIKETKLQARKQAEVYWNDKLATMGEAPELPTLNNTNLSTSTFSQKKIFLDNDMWQKFSEVARKNNFTPSVLIMSALSEVVSLWSSNNKFCINTTILNRPNVVEDVNEIVGDFTEVNVSSINMDYSKSYLERIKIMQKNLWMDLEHNQVSGVEVLRNLTKVKEKNIIIPVVFTSTLGVTNKSTITARRKINKKISQTPQVYIDCQASQENNGLTVNWDIRDGVFKESVINDMFDSFSKLLKAICLETESILSLKYPIKLSSRTLAIRNKVNNTKKDIKPQMMEEGFLKALKKYPNKTALITSEGEYTYKNLAQYVKSIIKILKDQNVKDGDKVGINISKNVWQIASALAVLLMKCTYVPIDINQPLIRKKKIINRAEIKVALGEDDELKDCCTNINVKSLQLGDSNLDYFNIDGEYDRPAYIIFTSGTTGEPKGVIISHRSAMNTISAVNQRYEIGAADVFFGLANMSFDLSVYDIFGCFAAAGTLVLPDSKRVKDPKYLYDLILIHEISVINSVPAQMQMIINYLEYIKSKAEVLSLKTIILSGDWIPVNLPQKLYNIFTKSRIASMGGATEAAIWSIAYDIGKDEIFNKSIPYGTPLPNQKFYILNSNMQHCPDYVEGSLYISGTGLSLGYLNNDEENRSKYMIFKENGERIYKTGDKGCYREDGVIIFKGRDAGDEQVKIHGHRIELSEIRSVLVENPLIDSAVTLALRPSKEDIHLDAVVSPVRRDNLSDLTEDDEEKQNLNHIGNEYEKGIKQQLFEKWLQKSNMVVVGDIYNTFKKYGIFISEYAGYTFEEIIKTINIPQKLNKLTKRWLDVLVAEGVIREKDNKYFLNGNFKDKLNPDTLWKEFYQLEAEFNYSKAFIDYLKKSSDLLPGLIQGKENPLDVLFPKGEVDPAMAAYHDNKINRMLNDIAKKEIDYLCKKENQHNPSKVFRILEIGAGVGGTAIDVIPSLAGCKVEYYFTDLSTFFLNKAKNNFGQYDWVKYGIFDINKNFAAQGHEAFSFDLILSANVLHNSKNVHDVMKNLKGLLKKDGSMIILEETKRSYMLLTSMEFKDGLTGFKDERKDNDQTFFTREQWQNIFKAHNGNVVYEFPSKDSKLDALGQTIYIVRFAGEYETIKQEDVRKYLKNTVSPYMVPSNIVVLPEIPLTNNKKIDLKAVRSLLEKIESKNAAVEESNDLPQTDLEKRIEQIWCKELNLKAIGRNESFYKIGGDSLLIAQVIGQMIEKIPETKGWQWSALLTEMMQTPTIREVAEKINNLKDKKEKFIDPCLVKIKESKLPKDKSVAKVLFHAGAGTLTPYNDLLSYIEQDSRDNESIIGFTFGNDAEYISMETSKTFNLLGKKYGKILKDLGYSSYILLGHCVGGLIALETAQYLKHNNIRVSDVTLISTGIPRKKDKTILADTTDEIYKKTLQSSLDNELLLERIFAKVIEADEYKAGYTTNEVRLQKYIEYIARMGTGEITVEALCNTKGEYEDVAEEFKRQSCKPISERLNALYNTIERPNGQLMEHQLKMLNVLFRIFSQNFRCVASYEPPVYDGHMRIFCCEIQGNSFYPGFFQEDYETWKPYAQGELEYDLIAGQHFDCLSSPNLQKNIKKILKFHY